MPDLKDLWRLVQVMNEIKAWRFSIQSFCAGELSLTPEQIKDLPFDPDAAMVYPPDARMPGIYAVQYTAGYVAPGTENAGTNIVPQDLQEAIRLTAASIWYAKGRDPNLKSESEQGVGSTSWNAPSAGSGGMPQPAVDSVNQIYQVSDAPFWMGTQGTQPDLTVLEGGVLGSWSATSTDGSWSYAGMVSDITTADPAAGTYVAESSSRGAFFRLGGTPVYTITCWATGAMPDGTYGQDYRHQQWQRIGKLYFPVSGLYRAGLAASAQHEHQEHHRAG